MHTHWIKSSSDKLKVALRDRLIACFFDYVLVCFLAGLASVNVGDNLSCVNASPGAPT